MEELRAGLSRWTGWHDSWKQHVGSVVFRGDDAVCIVDPLVTEWGTLDALVQRAALPVHVLITIFWHARSARDVVARYGANLWAPSGGRQAVERRAGEVTHPFRPGDELPSGIEAFASGRGSEVVYWIPAAQALIPGDVILGDADGGLRLCPESWLPQSSSHARVRKELAPLLDLPVELVLVSHGEPVLRGACEALRQACGVACDAASKGLTAMPEGPSDPS